MKRLRRTPIVDPERLTTVELLAAHERLFGPLAPQAKRRLLRTEPRPRPAAGASEYVLAA